MRDLLRGYKQRHPNLIEIEPTEGCNLGCSFCGLRGMRKRGTKPWNFMTVEDAEVIAKMIKEEGWNSRITFCGHGEPTLNPHLLDIIKIFRKELPKNYFFMFTNGAGFVNGNFEIKSFCKELQDIHFNGIIFDVYSNDGDWNVVSEIKDDYSINILGDNSDDGGFVKKTSKKNMEISLFPLEIEGNKNWRKMQNHCGAAAPLDFKKENTVCTKVFRELFIRYNGNVALCCDDFRGQYFVTNVLKEKNMSDVWNHERFQAARIRLFCRDRKFLPCHGCNCPPNKAGFLPDITGGKDKKYMPTEVSEEVIKITEEAYRKEGLTTIFKRKWEK